MILKGGSRGNPKQLANHLQKVDTNERVVILELQHPVHDLEDAFICWQTLSEGLPRAKKGLYHLNIDPHERYTMTPEQWRRSVDIAEKNLGLEGQSRAVVMHEKHGREHIHVVWCRMDYEQGKLRSDSQNYLKHEKASLAMEKEFGHEHVPGKHAKRDREKQPEFPRAEFNHTQWQQAERSGLDPTERKKQIRALPTASRTGEGFKTALEDAGYVLAQGERGYFVVDQAGDHSALSRNLGLKKAQLDAFMKSVPLEELPTLEDAKAQQKGRAAEAVQPAAPAAPEPVTRELSLSERKEQITSIRKSCDDAHAFKNALEQNGYILAKGDKRGFVLVDEQGEIFSLSKHLTDIKGKDYKAFMAPIELEALPSIDQAKALQVAHQQAAQERKAEEAAKAQKKGVEASKFLPAQPAKKTEDHVPAPAKPTDQPKQTSPAYDPAVYAPKRRAKKVPQQQAEQKPVSKFIPATKPDVAPPQPAKQKPDLTTYAPKPRKREPIPEYIKNQVKGLRTFSDNAASFKNALEAEGFTLARGDTGYLIIDKENNVHALVSVLEQKKDLVDAFMSPIALSKLSTPDEIWKGRRKPKTPTPPQPIAGTPAGWAPPDQGLYDLESSLAKRAKLDMEKLRDLHARQITDAEVQLDRDIAQKMADYKLAQDEQTEAFLAARKERRTGIHGILDAIQSKLNPTLAAEKAKAREKEYRDFYRRLAKERRDYEVLIQQTKREEMEALHEKQAHERKVRENKINEDRERYVREYREAKRVRAENEAKQLKEELKPAQGKGYKEGPEPPPIKGK